jgi:hypothetical protein
MRHMPAPTSLPDAHELPSKHLCRTAPAVRQARDRLPDDHGQGRWPGFSGISTTGLDAVVRACEMGNEA